VQLLAALGPWVATASADDGAHVPLAQLATHLVKCLYRATLSDFPNTMQVVAKSHHVFKNLEF
jgi:hypothetical protein